jgi:DNA-binding response OmpR family regulator
MTLGRYRDEDAHVLHAAADLGDPIHIGEYRFWVLKMRLARGNGKTVPLTRMEALLLLYLYRNRGVSTPIPVLLSDVWGYKTTSRTHTVETHIYRLRLKIDRLLVTDTGGYRLAL